MHEVRNVPGGRTVWCGPTAISILTGAGYDVSLDLLKRIAGKTWLTSVQTWMMCEALEGLGLRCHRLDVEGTPTLIGFLRRRAPDVKKSMLLINVTRHYVVARGRKIGDNTTMGPVWMKDFRRHRRSRVEKVWVVEGEVNKDVIRNIRKLMERKETVKYEAAKERGGIRNRFKRRVIDLNLDFELRFGNIYISVPEGGFIEEMEEVVIYGPNPWMEAMKYIEGLDPKLIERDKAA